MQEGVIVLATNSKQEHVLLGYEPQVLEAEGMRLPPDFAVLASIPTNDLVNALHYLNALFVFRYTNENILKLSRWDIRLLAQLARLDF